MADPYLTPEEEDELRKLQGWRQSPSYTPQDSVVPGPSFDRPLVSLTGQVSTDPGVLGGVQGPADRSWNSRVDPTKQATGQRGYDPRFDDPDYGKEKKDEPTPWRGGIAERPSDPYNPSREPGSYDRTRGTDERGRSYQGNRRGEATQDEGPTFWGRLWAGNPNPDAPDVDWGGSVDQLQSNWQSYYDQLGANVSELDAAAAQGPADDAWGAETTQGVWGRVKDWWNKGSEPKYDPNMTTEEAAQMYGQALIPDNQRAIETIQDWDEQNKAVDYAQQGWDERRSQYPDDSENRRDEEGNLIDDPTVKEAYAQGYDEADAEWQRVPAGWWNAAKETATEYKEGVGADTLGEATRRWWNIKMGNLFEGSQIPFNYMESAPIPGSEFTAGEVTAAFLGAVTNPDEIREGISPAQNIAENFASNLVGTYENAHGGKDREDMTPEEREAVEWSSVNAFSGREAQANTYEMLEQRDEVVQRMADIEKELYANGDATTAAMVGAERERIANMTEREIVDENFDVWREIGPQIFLDPLNLVDGFVSAAAIGPVARRVSKAFNDVMGVAPDEVFEVAGELATAVNNGTTTADRARGLSGFFGYTADSKAAQDAGSAWAGVMRMFGGIDDKATANRMWTALVEHPETLPEILDDLDKGTRSLTDKRTVEALKNLLPWVAESVQNGTLKMDSLAGTGAFDARKFASDLFGGFSAAAKSHWKVTDDGNLLGSIPNFMRAVMSEQFLNTSIGHLFKNATSAVGHLVTDGQMSLRRMDDIVADLTGKLDSMGIVRADEAYGGVSDAGRVTQGAQAQYGGAGRRQKVRKYVPGLGHILVDENGVPRWAGAGMFGEQNFYTRGFYASFINSLQDSWPKVVSSYQAPAANQATAAAAQGAQAAAQGAPTGGYAGALMAAGVPQAQAQALANIMTVQGVKGNRKSIQQAVQNYVSAGNSPLSLSAMGLEGNEFIEPTTYMAVSEILNDAATGGRTTDEAVAAINNIFDAERTRLAELMADAGGTDPARHFSTAADDTRDAAEAARNYNNAASRAGQDGRAGSRELTQMFYENNTAVRTGMQEAMANAGDLTPEKTGVFMDAWREVQDLKTKGRIIQNRAWKEYQESGGGNAAWKKYEAAVRKGYNDMFAAQREIINDLPLRMAEAPAGYRSTSQSSVDLLEKVAGYKPEELVDDIASGDTTKAIQAQRKYVDYYEVDMYVTAQRLGINDVNIDVVASAHQDVEQAALRAVGDVNELRNMAYNGAISWNDFYKQSSGIWKEWARETAGRYEVAKKDMYRAAGQAYDSRPPAGTEYVAPTLDEIFALASDAGIATRTDSGANSDRYLLNFANKHLQPDRKWKSMDELDDADLMALEGKLEQRARRVAAGVTEEDGWINPAYGDATYSVPTYEEFTAAVNRGDITVELPEPQPANYVPRRDIREMEAEAENMRRYLDDPEMSGDRDFIGQQLYELEQEIDAAKNLPNPVEYTGGEGDEAMRAAYDRHVQSLAEENNYATANLTDDDVGEIVKIDGKYYTVTAGDNIEEVYNSSTRARMAAGNTVSPTISDAIQVQYQNVTAAQQRVVAQLTGASGVPPVGAATPPVGAATPPVAGLTPGTQGPLPRNLQQAVMNVTNQWLAYYDDVLYASVRAGEAGADFSMLNYAARRGYDTMIAGVVPFHYWYTRSAKNWLERIAAHPGMVSAYIDADKAVESNNEQAGVPNRYQNQVRVGNTDYFTRNPWSYFVPISDIYEANNFDNPDEAKTWASRSLATAGVLGMGTFPILEMGVAASEGDWDRFTDSSRNALWPYPLVADAYKTLTGEELIPVLEDSLDPYRESRTFAAMATEKGDEYANTVALYAQQMTANRTNGVDPMTNIPAHMAEDVMAMYEEGRREEGRQSLVRSASRMLGPSTAYLDPNEVTAAEVSSDWRNAGYSPSGNQAGSQRARDEIRDENPFVSSWWARTDLLPDNIAEANPGQQAQTTQYWDEYLAISEREMKALTQAVIENPSISSDELREMRGEYWEQKEALDAKYPDRLESTDARYKATGTKDRRQGGMNPIEEANQIVMDVLAYKPPKPRDMTDEFGWPPQYPEGLDPDNNPKDKETQLRYYEAKGTYEEDRVTHASRVLEQLAVEQGQGGMMASQMYVEQILLGQYTTELLRGYDSRYESIELMARNEQWDIQGAQKQEDFARWEAEKQARLATVADAMGVEVAQAMDAYSDLPESQKAAYREAHPELYEAWAMAYNPTQYAETKALFGDDIYELARGYTPYGEDKEAWKQWRDSHSEEDYTRLKAYWGYSKEQKELRGEQVDAGDGFTMAPKWTDVSGTQEDPRNKGQQPIGWQYDMTYPGGEPTPATPPPGWQGLDEPGVPDRLMGQGQATQERIMPDGSPADPRVMEREEYLAGPHEFNPYLGFDGYKPPPGTREGPSYTDYDNTSFGPPAFMPGGNQYNEVPGYNALPDITPAERLEGAGGEAALPDGFLEEVQAAAYADALAGGATPEQAAEAAAAAGASYGGGGGGGGRRRGSARSLPDLRPYEQRLMAWRMDPWRLYQPNAQGRYGQHLAPQREWRPRV